MCREVTRLDGAWGKKQVWRPHVWTWGLSEANVLFWKKCLWHCWDFLVPRSDSAPGDLFPLLPRYVSGVMQWKSENFPKANKFSSPNVMNICNFRIQYRLDLAQTANKGYWRHFRFICVVLCHVYASPPSFFRVVLCFFANNKTFRTFNKLLF